MTEIQIGKVILRLPDGYVKPPLPGLKKWTDALRSGRYAQGINYLCRNGSYCCLGVLCELQGRPRRPARSDGVVVFDGQAQSLDGINPVTKALRSAGDLPRGVLCRIDGLSNEFTDAGSLAEFNDAKVSFNDIATIIETLWEDA